MFTQLQNALSATHKSVVLNITIKDGQLIVLAKPELKDDAKAAFPQLAAPFVLKGTAEELDQGFLAAFSQQVGAVKTLAEQAAAQQAALDAAAKKAAEEAASKRKKTPSVKPGAKATTSALDVALQGGDSMDGDDDENDGNTVAESGATSVTAGAARQPAEPVTTGDDLFAFN